MEERTSVGWVVVAIVAIVAIVGLVLLFKANITGNFLNPYIPTAAELRLTCDSGLEIGNQQIDVAVRNCLESGGKLVRAQLEAVA